MSLRSIWIINISNVDFGSILLYRRFPTVEKKCKVVYKENYVSVPPASVFASKLLVTLGLADSKQFVGWRDEVRKVMQLPVVELKINNKVLWPIVSITQGSYLVCCLPFVENFKNVDKNNLLQVPSISIGFTVLLGMMTVLGSITNTEHKQSRLIDLDNYLSMCMPFGTPSDVELTCSSSMLNSPAQKYFKKQPAWKPVEFRGKQTINFKINEFVRSVQNRDAGGFHSFEIFGQVAVKAELEGGVNDVSLSVNSINQLQPLSLNSLVIHPCVTIPGGSSVLGTGLPKRLRFSPPLYEFVLFHYTSSVPEEPPIEGVFKMLGENNVEMLIQLKLNEKVKNSFDFCDLILVFFNRGPVKNMEISANHGVSKLSDDKYSLKWTLGSKFPKDLEAVLKAKLEFQEEPLLPNSDPFCVGNNCYVQINFKQSNTTLSGCNIDPKSVIVTEGNKPKIIMERRVQSAEYRIWNTYGEVPFPTKIEEKFSKMLA